jgi:hypothetical protein
MDETPKDFSDHFAEMVAQIGITIMSWQYVEDTHYLLFNKMVRVQPEDICSILYFSPPTFESRRVLVDRVAQIYLDQKIWSVRWTKLNKRLETAASQRGTVVHYSLDYEVQHDQTKPAEYTVSSFRLAPSRYDKVQELRGRSRTSETHQVTVKKMQEHAKSFGELANDLKDFILEIPDNPNYPTGQLLRVLAGPEWTSLKSPPPAAPTPSSPEQEDGK